MFKLKNGLLKSSSIYNSCLRKQVRCMSYASAAQAREQYNVDIDRLHEYPKAWTPKNLDMDRIKYTYSPGAQKEIIDFVKKTAELKTTIDDVEIDRSHFPEVKKELDFLEQRNLLEGESFALIQPIEGMNSIYERRLASFVQTNVLGEALVQNAEGVKAICVYDRDSTKKMKDGQRYHQSREGGSIHTDNVNIPEIWEYMFLSCIKPALLGGETILCSTFTIHNILMEIAPSAIDVLRQDFWWEYRGFNDQFYRAPILFYNEKGEPMLRYLRDYLESAYIRKEITLTDEQIWAMDMLDCVAQISDVQLRYNLKAGETLLCTDVSVLHGRTPFVDYTSAKQLYDQNAGKNRLLQRTWVKKIYNTEKTQQISF